MQGLKEPFQNGLQFKGQFYSFHRIPGLIRDNLHHENVRLLIFFVSSIGISPGGVYFAD